MINVPRPNGTVQSFAEKWSYNDLNSFPDAFILDLQSKEKA